MIVLIELFGRIFLDYLFIIPAVLIRWTFLKITGRGQTLEHCYKHKPAINGGLAIGVLIVIGIINNIVQ